MPEEDATTNAVNQIRDAMVENAKGPKRVVADGVSADQHSLPDQIKALEYVTTEEAGNRPHRGLRFTKLKLKGPGY